MYILRKGKGRLRRKREGEEEFSYCVTLAIDQMPGETEEMAITPFT